MAKVSIRRRSRSRAGVGDARSESATSMQQLQEKTDNADMRKKVGAHYWRRKSKVKYATVCDLRLWEAKRECYASQQAIDDWLTSSITSEHEKPLD